MGIGVGMELHFRVFSPVLLARFSTSPYGYRSWNGTPLLSLFAGAAGEVFNLAVWV